MNNLAEIGLVVSIINSINGLLHKNSNLSKKKLKYKKNMGRVVEDLRSSFHTARGYDLIFEELGFVKKDSSESVSPREAFLLSSVDFLKKMKHTNDQIISLQNLCKEADSMFNWKTYKHTLKIGALVGELSYYGLIYASDPEKRGSFTSNLPFTEEKCKLLFGTECDAIAKDLNRGVNKFIRYLKWCRN